MRLSPLGLTAALWWQHGVREALARPGAQQATSTSADPDAMTDPAERTYPTTFTRVQTATTAIAPSVVVVDTTTLIDPWPVSPDFELIPMTMLQTGITVRTVSTINALTNDTPTRTTLSTTSTWIMWGTAVTDMAVRPGPQCAQVQGADCNPPAVKQHPRCDELGRDTRCAAQCLLKDWLWWCYQHTAADKDLKPMGKLCYGNSTAYEQLLEPCDHTDFAPDCLACAPGQNPFGSRGDGTDDGA